MSEKYFNKFPQINYANTACIDITKRVTMETGIAHTGSIYYQYTLKHNTRPDVISQNYYQDPYMDWLLYLNNGIVDPYYDWYLSDYEFNKFITQKYGDIETSQRTIAYYELNFKGSETEITADFYNNNMANILKKYFTPVYGQGTKVIAYKRRTDNTTRNTNRIVQLSFSNTSSFNVGQLLDIKNNTNSTIVGSAAITFVAPTFIIVNNVNGDLSVGNYVTGLPITATQILFINITDDEYAYWKSKSFYDVEFDKNEANRQIRILHSNYAIPVAEKMRKALKD